MLRIGLPDRQAAKERQRLDVAAVAQYRIDDVGIRHAVRLARHEVLDAISRRRVHDARAAFGRHIVAEIDRRRALVARMRGRERVMKAQVRELLALGGREGRAGEAVALQALLDALFREDQQPARRIDEAVRDLRMHVERLVGGNGPRRRRPDDDAAFRLRQRGKAEGPRGLFRFREGEHHVDGRIGLVLVLDFRFGKRRAAVETPVHRLQAAKHIALLKDLRERADLAGLVDEVHRLVRIVPVAEHAQAPETRLLLLDLLAGVGACLLHHFGGGQRLAELLFDLDLDRHAVAVPARHVDGVEAREIARLDDHVLQDLVDRVAEVDVAVRVRRAVVQDELFAATARGADLLVDLLVLPFLDPRRLALGQVAAHRERRVEQVDRVFRLRLGVGLRRGFLVAHG